MAPAMRGVMMGPDELATRRQESNQASNRAISTLIRDFREKLRFRPQNNQADMDNDGTPEPSQAQEIRWLKKRLQFDFPDNEADELIAILEHLPLPTARLAPTRPGQPAQPDPILSVFLRNLRNEENLIDLEPDQQDSQSTITKAIVSLIQISFIQVVRLDPAAIRLLCFMSVLNNKGIPNILLKNFKEKEPVLESTDVQVVSVQPRRNNNPFRYLRPGRRNRRIVTANRPKTFEDSLDTLLEYSFITEDVNGEKYSMNKLVQQAATNWIEARSETKYWHRRVTEVFHRVFHSNKADLLGNFLSLMPHVQTVILDKPVPETLYETCDSGEDREYLLTRVGLLNEFASECTEHGLLELAEVVVSEASEINAKLFPPHRSSTLWTQSRYGHVLNAHRNMADGKLQEAEKRLREAVDSVDANSEERHALPALLTSLGESLYQQSKFDEAHEVFERAVKDSEETVGDSHARTLNCLRNLAVNHIARFNYQIAEDLQTRVVKAKERTLGSQHPETLLSKTDLGRVFQAHGKYPAAESVQRDVSETFESTLGGSHSWTLLSLYRLATALNLQGKNEEALTVNTYVLEEREKLYRQDTHQAMVATIKQQAFILRALKKYDESETFFIRSKASHVAALGTDHRRTTDINAEYEALLKLKEEELNEKNAETMTLVETNSETSEGDEQMDGSLNEKSGSAFGSGTS